MRRSSERKRPLPDINNSTKSTKASNEQVDRASPDVAAAGQCDSGLAETSQQRPDDEEPTSNLANGIRTRLEGVDPISVNQVLAITLRQRDMDLGTQRGQNGSHISSICYIGDIVKLTSA